MLVLIRDVKGLGMGTQHVRKTRSCTESPASPTKICQLVGFSDTNRVISLIRVSFPREFLSNETLFKNKDTAPTSPTPRVSTASQW